ncbi:MAG: NAD-dependent malic enzyme, partial [Oscillospiraceae bacterium]|nr:NAD-dependent malic enzyme [Oscillospiraceae bacterium]MCL2280224.1 NAD-dependent malic enzyme [Oscillospiraceae bacterium]
VFRGALDTRAPDITPKMNLAAAGAIAAHVRNCELSPDFIVPSPLDKSVAVAVATAVANAAR